MPSQTPQILEDRVRALAGNPMFQLSTAGMELFHTNLLYWLATERPDESQPLWRKLGIGAARSIEYTPFVRREWKHLDLVISPGLGQGALVLENKVGAIPTPGQLDGYYADLQRGAPFARETASWVLLTLTTPNFNLTKPWRSVTYADLLPALEETTARLTGDDAALVASYTKMVAALDQVAKAYDPQQSLDGPVAISLSERTALQEARLTSLVEKIRASRFGELVTRALLDRLPDRVAVESGLSNGSAINSFFVPIGHGRSLGWQVQANQFRLVVLTGPNDPKVRRDREALVERLYPDYFDFATPHPLTGLLQPYVGKKPWLGYEPNFTYRYSTLAPTTTWRELLELVTFFSTRAHELATAR